MALVGRPAVDRATRPSAVTASRLAAHSLAQRADAHDLLEVVGRCGIQNSPPGSALLSVHARVAGVDPAGFEQLVQSRQLLQTWAMRGAPYFVPTADAAIFTTVVLPPSEQALRHFLPGLVPAVDELRMTVSEAAAVCGAELDSVLGGRQLAIGELGREVADRIGPKLTTAQRAAWEREGPYAKGQPLGQAVVHFCVRVLTLQGVVCFASRKGNRTPLVLVTDWLGSSYLCVQPEVARAELLRRYLRCYGPSTQAGFAAWLGLQVGDVGDWWDLTAPDSGDRPAPGVQASGVRLLPPNDPYLRVPDRQMIVPTQYHQLVWPRVGAPGVVLSDGLVAGVWRARKKGRRLGMTIELFGACGNRLDEEAQAVGRLRGADSVEVAVSGHG